HGLLLVLYRVGGPSWDRLPALARQLLFFLLVVIGWVYFKSDSLTVAHEMIRTMFVPTAGESGAPVIRVLVMIAIAAVGAMFGPNAIDLHRDFEWKFRHAVVAAIVLGASFAIMAGGRNSPFLYFQF